MVLDLLVSVEKLTPVMVMRTDGVAVVPVVCVISQSAHTIIEALDVLVVIVSVCNSVQVAVKGIAGLGSYSLNA